LATELFAGGLPPRPRSWGRTSIDWPAIDAMSGRFKTPERTRPCAKLSLRHGGNNRHGFTSSYTLFCELFRLPVTSRRPGANCGRRMQANVSTSIGKYSTCWGWAQPHHVALRREVTVEDPPLCTLAPTSPCGCALCVYMSVAARLQTRHLSISPPPLSLSSSSLAIPALLHSCHLV
jgi:hypothetical protein